MHRPVSMMRETGTAFAVLAIFILTLLLPLHQAAGLQRNLASLGYQTAAAWSVCSSPQLGNDQGPAAVKCPAAGMGKHQFAGTLPTAIGVEPPTAAFTAADPFASFSEIRGLSGRQAQPRAPPALV